MNDPAWQSRGPWRVLMAPGRNRADLVESLLQLPHLVERDAAPLVRPGRHRVDRLLLSYGDATLDAVIKSYGAQAAWRDRLARHRGSKAERAFRNALILRRAGVETPAPIAVVERWEGARLHDSRLVSAFVPRLTSFRDELERIYTEAPRCTPLMTLLECVARATRAFHDAGLLHRDLGNQNIALQYDPDQPHTPWKVLFLDLNRARHAPNPTPAQRGADLARLDLPSDFRRVFHAMYYDGYAPPPDFAAAERRARAAFARHTALRPLRHPLREARIRRATANDPRPLRGRDLWIWDDRSAQAIPAYTSRDRRKFMPAANVTSALSGLLRTGPTILRHYRELIAQSFQQPVPFAGAIGLTLDAEPSTWTRQLNFLDQLQGAQRIPLLLRVYHHQNTEAWHWTLDQAAGLHQRGHSVALALVQDRRALRDPQSWRQMLTLAFDHAHAFADFFEVGHAVNRSKWGVWDYREYAQLLQPLRAILAQYPDVRVTGPACIDFEPLAMAGILANLPADIRFQALSHHLYVDRRGAPENRQGRFDTVAKCALLRAFAKAHRLPEDRPLITEVNWPLLGTGPWSPVTSPYETLDPRRNDPSVSEDTYASFMARYLLLTLASGHIARVYWWRLAARGFGLIDDTDPAAWSPRPAFHTLQTLLRQLEGATFARRLDAPPGEYALEFTRPDTPAPLVARWTLDTPPVFS